MPTDNAAWIRKGCTGFGDCDCDECYPASSEPLTPLAEHGKPLGLFRSLWVVLRGVRLIWVMPRRFASCSGSLMGWAS